MSFDKFKKEQLDLEGLQATLQSGTNIKTVGGQSLLGSGDIPVSVEKATSTVLGTVMTDITETQPIVYTKTTIDLKIGDIETILLSI